MSTRTGWPGARRFCGIRPTALGVELQIENQVGAALHVGLTQEEIVEAILQTAPVGGITRPQNATMAAARVVERRGGTARPTA